MGDEQTGSSQDPTQPGSSEPRRESKDTARPKPAYGEYAPEGWEWKPEEEAGTAPATNAPSTAVTGAAAPASQAAARGAGPVPGVPHNLGVPGNSAPPQSLPASPSHTTAPQSGQRPEQPTTQQPAVQDPHVYRASAPEPQARQGLSPGRLADRIVTIVLIMIGAFGALSLADSLFRLPSQLVIVADILGVEDIAIPDAVGVLGTVSGIIVLALYAVTLIFSIQRMRARKLAFFIPLAAGLIAFIVMMAASMIAFMLVPDLVQQASDPNAMNLMLDYLAETSQ